MTAIAQTDATLLNSYVAAQSKTTAAASAETSSSTSALNANFDTFLQILTAQLRNQDPTEPMDASKFTSQLVQYSQVEQQLNTNSKLDSILSSINSNGITPLLSYVGQYVESSTDGQMVVQNGASLLAYNLPSKAQTVAISVQDKSGNVIAKVDGTTTAGMNRVAWDGTLDSGAAATDGVYKFVLTAKDSSGQVISVSDMRTIGQVTGLETDSTGATHLMVGNLKVSDDDVMSVFGTVAASGDTQTSS